MRGRKQREVEEAAVDLTPMLDVVFILLIFFIVTAVFLDEHAQQLEPPPPQTDTPSEPVPVILIRVDGVCEQPGFGHQFRARQYRASAGRNAKFGCDHSGASRSQKQDDHSHSGSGRKRQHRTR
jgi:hypothetical protein